MKSLSPLAGRTVGMNPNEVKPSSLYHSIHVVTLICTLRNLSKICCGTVVTSEIFSVLKMEVRLIICKKATKGQTSMLELFGSIKAISNF